MRAITIRMIKSGLLPRQRFIRWPICRPEVAHLSVADSCRLSRSQSHLPGHRLGAPNSLDRKQRRRSDKEKVASSLSRCIFTAMCAHVETSVRLCQILYARYFFEADAEARFRNSIVPTLRAESSCRSILNKSPETSGGVATLLPYCRITGNYGSSLGMETSYEINALQNSFFRTARNFNVKPQNSRSDRK
jgi:hypothetical protein